MIDTGLDVNHPEFAGQVARVFDTSSGGADVTDLVGHGTFVSGLISALDGNGRGGKGVAGTTKLIAVRASTDGGFTVGDLISGIDFSIRRGADVINMSLAGDAASFTRTPGACARGRVLQRRAPDRRRGQQRRETATPSSSPRPRSAAGAAGAASASRSRPRSPTAAWRRSRTTTSS